MKVIQSADCETLLFLIKNYKADGPLRKMKYCIQLSVDEGVLLLNHITKELLLLDGTEMSAFYQTDYAREHWFAVAEQMDEMQMVCALRESFCPGPTDISQHKDLLYLIYTTTCCNARCPYCYEIGHHNNITMSRETAEKTADFIINRTLPEQKIGLEWMGGEPLLNTRAMDVICTKIKESGREYFSFMATNGYLINDEMVEKATGLWKLQAVQITIDGLEEEYNAIKRYTDKAAKSQSPFLRVLDNIERLLNANIAVEIHLHITEENGEDMLALIAYLYLRFGPRNNLKIVTGTYFERIFDDINRRSEDAEKGILSNQIEAIDMIRRFGYYKPLWRTQIRSTHCNPDSNRQLNILPDGKLGWCDEIIDRDFLGTVEGQDLDVQVIKKYRERMEDLPECAECPHYPDCIRLKCCFQDVPWCTDEYRKLKAYKLQTDILYTYQKFRQAQRKTENGND